jgi:hypothetical protein
LSGCRAIGCTPPGRLQSRDNWRSQNKQGPANGKNQRAAKGRLESSQITGATVSKKDLPRTIDNHAQVGTLAGPGGRIHFSQTMEISAAKPPFIPTFIQNQSMAVRMIYDSEERFSITTSALFQALRSDQKQPLFVVDLGWGWRRFATTNEGCMEKTTGESFDRNTPRDSRGR